jgi:AcrR family transcriptional regulator
MRALTDEGLRTRELLLSACKELLIQLGPDEVRTERVAKAAGVSKALVYRHFCNVEDILVALYRQEMWCVGLEVRRALRARPQQGDSEQIHTAIGAFLNSIDRRQTVLTPLFAPGSLVPELAQVNGGGVAAVRTLTAQLGRLGGYDDASFHVIHGAAIATVSAWLHEGVARREVADVLARVVIAALGVDDVPTRQR